MANYNSIHTGAEIDAAISQIQILDDSLRGASVSVSVSTSGSATPADPLNDPFDTVTNAVKWVSENYALVDYLYVDIGAGTFSESGLHYDPAQLPFSWRVPTNIYHVDMWGAGVASTALNFGTRVLYDGDAFSKMSFSNVKVIANSLYWKNGTESYDDFTFQSASASGFTYSTIQGRCLFYGNVTFSHAGSTNLTRPVIRFQNALVDASNVTTFAIDATNDPASGRLIYAENSILNFDGVTLVNQSTNSMDVYAGPGTTLIQPSVLTNCTASYDDNSIPTRSQAALP